MADISIDFESFENKTAPVSNKIYYIYAVSSVNNMIILKLSKLNQKQFEQATSHALRYMKNKLFVKAGFNSSSPIFINKIHEFLPTATYGEKDAAMQSVAKKFTEKNYNVLY